MLDSWSSTQQTAKRQLTLIQDIQLKQSARNPAAWTIGSRAVSSENMVRKSVALLEQPGSQNIADFQVLQRERCSHKYKGLLRHHALDLLCKILHRAVQHNRPVLTKHHSVPFHEHAIGRRGRMEVRLRHHV